MFSPYLVFGKFDRLPLVRCVAGFVALGTGHVRRAFVSRVHDYFSEAAG